MPTTYNDQAYPVDIFNVNAGDPLNVVSITLVDTDDDGLIEVGETINGFTITNVWVNDTVDVGGVTITGVTFTTSGGPFFTPNDGSILVNGTAGATTTVTVSTSMPVTTLGPPCFVAGTLIATPSGLRPVESLNAGDFVKTRDNGAKPLLWVGHAHVPGHGPFAPVEIQKGAIGNPKKLLVSQQHRILLNSAASELSFGFREVFAAAKHLVDGVDFKLKPTDEMHYVHIMCDQHEIVQANGVWAESFYYGDQAVAGVTAESRQELVELFADNPKARAKFEQTARYCLTAREAASLGYGATPIAMPLDVAC